MYKMPPLMRKAPVSRPRGREWMRKARWARAHFWPIKTLEWAPKSASPSNLGTLAPSSSHSAARTHPGQNSLVVPSSLRFPSFHHIPKSKTPGNALFFPVPFLPFSVSCACATVTPRYSVRGWAAPLGDHLLARCGCLSETCNPQRVLFRAISCL